MNVRDGFVPEPRRRLWRTAPKVTDSTKPSTFQKLTAVFSHISHFKTLKVCGHSWFQTWLHGHAYNSSQLTLLKINIYFPHISTLLYWKHFNIIFPSKIKSSNLSFSFRLFRRKLCINFAFHHACDMLRPQLRHSCSFTIDTSKPA